MPVVEVLGHVFADDCFIGFEEVEILAAFFRGEFEGDVADVEGEGGERVFGGEYFGLGDAGDRLFGSAD